jgi:hypothetical protein
MYNVYLISAEINDEKLYKIGYTRRDVSKRLKELKTGNPAHFEIENNFHSKYGTKIEAQLHKRYYYKKIDGEWFNLSDDDIINFENNCIKIEENYKLLENNTYMIDKGYI